MKNIAITFAKIIGWITASVLGLAILLIVLVQIPGIQNIIIDEATSRLSEKLNTRVEIGNFRLAIPEFISINELYIEDQENDTLLYTGSLRVDVDFSALFDQKIQIDRLAISNLVANLYRPDNDSTFNFNFIMESFGGDTTSTESAPADTTQGGWTFGLNAVNLRNINFSMQDHYSGSLMEYNIGDFSANIGEFDLDSLNFGIDDIRLANSEGSIRITKIVPDTTESEPTPPLNLGLNQLTLESIVFTFDNEVDSMSFDLDLGEFVANAEQINYPDQKFQLDQVRLADTRVNYQMFSPVDTTASETSANEEEPTLPWIFSTNQLVLDDIAVNYDNTALPYQPEGIDFNHLAVENLDFDVEELFFSTELEIKGIIERFNFKEQSGFILQNLETELVFNDNEARLENLNIKTPHSDIQRKIVATYPALDLITEKPADVGVDVDLNETQIGVSDIFYLVPGMRETLNPGLAGRQLQINLRLEGTLADLIIPQARLQALNSTSLALNGTIRNLLQQENLFFDINLANLSTQPADLKLLMPAGSLPDSLTLPKRINLSGKVNGHIDRFTSSLDLNTSLGNLNARIAMNDLTGETPVYRAALSLDQFQAGTVLQQDSLLGPVTMTGNISGSSFDLQNMKLNYDFKFPGLTLLDYTYDSLGLTGELQNQMVDANLAVADSNLVMNLNSTISLDTANPVYKADLKIEGADLEKLNLSNEDISVVGTFVADFEGDNLNQLQGNLNVKNVTVVKEGAAYRLDSLIFISLNDIGKTDLSIESDLLDAEVKGNLQLTDFVPVLKHHFNQYYSLQSVQEVDTLKPQDFTFSIDLKDPQFLTEVLVPGLDNYVPGQITGAFDSQKDSLRIDLSIPQLTYNNIEVDTMVLNVTSDQDMVYYVLSISQLAQGDITLDNFGISGQIYNDQIETRLQITDEESREQYAFGGVFSSEEGDYRFRVEPPELILNYDTWQVNPDSYISFGASMFINNLNITKNDQQIKLNTVIEEGDSATQLVFDQFHLETISRILESESSLFRGIMNGTARFNSGPEGSTFNSDLEISNFAFRKDTVGQIALNAVSTPSGVIELDLTIDGNENDVQVAGNFNPAPEGMQLDMVADFNNLNLASIQGFVTSQFSTLDGSMAGRLSVQGTLGQPAINGSLTFNEATLALKMLGAEYNLNNATIEFDDRGIAFNSFQITDRNGSPATLEGNIFTDNYTDFNFDLNFSSNNFLALNTTAESEQPYYGTAIVDTEAQITGDLNTPEIQTTISLQEGTRINYALPDNQPVTVEQEGIVKFVDKDQNLNPILREALKEEADTSIMEIQGMDLTANIQIDDDVVVRIIIDEDAGDYLQVRGSSTLSLEIDPTGNINLTGRYQIEDGKYQLSFYQFVRREFDIQEGSSITWSGDPFNARLDITAIHIVDTSPLGIMTSNRSSMSRQEASQYGELIPIAVYLNIEGELEEPRISFELNVEEGETGALASQVSNRLSQINEQQNELNKQVFSLLVLQRFLPDNPFNAGDGGLAATARSSVSKLLTQQLNQLSQNLDVVDLSFDVQSYDLGQEDTQARTELEIGLSKTFFNDRINVKVGSNIELEGPRADQQENVSDYVGDIQVQYKLTPDGRLLLEFFRQNVYEEMIETELVETGIGLIFRRDYNKLKEFFEGSEEDKGFK